MAIADIGMCLMPQPAVCLNSFSERTMRKKKMGAPLKRGAVLLSTGITRDLDSKYETFAEASFTTKTELKRLALEWVMAEIDAGRLSVRREHRKTLITSVLLPESQEQDTIPVV